MNVTTTLPYSDQPLIQPLIKFHKGWIKGRLLTPLPQEGKAAEIAKRVALFVVAFFAYPILGCIALVGLAFPKTITTPIPAEDASRPPPPEPFSTGPLLQPPQSLLASLPNTFGEKKPTSMLGRVSNFFSRGTANPIAQAKLFMRLNCNEFSRIFNETLSSPPLNNVITQLRSFEEQARSQCPATTLNFDVTWVTLIKDKKNHFWIYSHSQSKQPRSSGESGNLYLETVKTQYVQTRWKNATRTQENPLDEQLNLI